MADLSFTNSSVFSTPGAWFTVEDDGAEYSASLVGTPYQSIGPGGPISTNVVITLHDVSIAPEPPAGSVVVSTSTNPEKTISISVSIPVVSAIGDPGFDIATIRYISAEGSVGVVHRFEDVPASARHVVSYETAPATHPKYTLSMLVDDKPGTPSGVFDVVTQSFSLQFGAEPNYNPSRDALVAAVSARR